MKLTTEGIHGWTPISIDCSLELEEEIYGIKTAEGPMILVGLLFGKPWVAIPDERRQYTGAVAAEKLDLARALWRQVVFPTLLRAALNEASWAEDGGTIVCRERRVFLGPRADAEPMRTAIETAGFDLERGEEDPQNLYLVERQVLGPDGQRLDVL